MINAGLGFNSADTNSGISRSCPRVDSLHRVKSRGKAVKGSGWKKTVSPGSLIREQGEELERWQKHFYGAVAKTAILQENIDDGINPGDIFWRLYAPQGWRFSTVPGFKVKAEASDQSLIIVAGVSAAFPPPIL